MVFFNSNKGPVSLKSLVIIKSLEYVFTPNSNEPRVLKITRACLRCTLKSFFFAYTADFFNLILSWPLTGSLHLGWYLKIPFEQTAVK